MVHPPRLAALLGDAEIEALFSDEADLRAMLRVEAALAKAEADVGLVPAEAAARIGEVCARFQPDLDALESGLARDGVVVPDLVRQLRAAVGPPHDKAVHRAATSQDIVDTSLVLRLGTVADVLDARLGALMQTLEDLARRDGAIEIMAQTRMQQALSFTVADKVATWRGPLGRHRQRLAEIRPRLLVLQLGGPVGTRAEFLGQGDGVDAAMAAALGLGHAPAWHSQRDAIAEFGSWLSLVSGSLGKIGQDVALMAQTEIGAVRVSAAGGSSAMPHKQNPVQAELLVALARFNAGLAGTLHQALVHENERSGAAWTLEWLVLPQMAIATGAGLAKARTLIDGLRVAAKQGSGFGLSGGLA